jgi:hypothetical protein
MVLLATLTGFPRQASFVFRELLSLDPTFPLRSVIDILKPLPIPDSETETYRNGVVQSMSVAEANEWMRLHSSLSGLTSRLPVTMDPLKRWAPRVARFSFRVGKIVGARPLCSDVRITYIDYDPPAGTGEEFVLIENLGDTAELMTDWTLSDLAHNTFTFPAFTLRPRGSIKVWIKSGKDTEEDLFWGRKAAVWNNSGDTAFLRDADGALVSTYSY